MASKTFVRPLGSGSDFTVFLQRLGVASSDQSFALTPTDAVYHYHSIYDSQSWQERYGDPGFHRHVRCVLQYVIHREDLDLIDIRSQLQNILGSLV